MIEDDVTILHDVTLGVRRAVEGRRHPYVKKGAFIGANAQLLGTITIGAFSKVGAGAIVLNTWPIKPQWSATLLEPLTSYPLKSLT